MISATAQAREACWVLALELGAVASLFPEQARASVVVRIRLCPVLRCLKTFQRGIRERCSRWWRRCSRLLPPPARSCYKICCWGLSGCWGGRIAGAQWWRSIYRAVFNMRKRLSYRKASCGNTHVVRLKVLHNPQLLHPSWSRVIKKLESVIEIVTIKSEFS